jgi:hypothetical protein
MTVRIGIWILYALIHSRLESDRFRGNEYGGVGVLGKHKRNDIQQTLTVDSRTELGSE